jgi:hypothetical protein
MLPLDAIAPADVTPGNRKKRDWKYNEKQIRQMSPLAAHFQRSTALGSSQIKSDAE